MPTVRRFALYAVLLASARAGAQPAPPEPGPAPAVTAPPARRIAVIVMSGGGVEPETAADLTEVLIAAVAAEPGREVIGKEEFQARLGQDEAQSRQCIESPICLANVGTELSVDEIIAGTVGARDGGFTIRLIRQEIATGEVRGRFSRDVQGQAAALPPVLQAAAAEIYREPERPAELRVDANVEGAEVFVDDARVGTTPLRLAEVAPGSHRVRVDSVGWRGQTRRVRLRSGGHAELDFTLVEAPEERLASSGSPPSTLAVVTTWTSAGLAVASAALGTVFALRSQSGFPDDATQREASSALDTREDEALVANIAFAGAGTLAALALYMLVFQGDAVFGADAEGAP
jgi:hypothetical protein